MARALKLDAQGKWWVLALVCAVLAAWTAPALAAEAEEPLALPYTEKNSGALDEMVAKDPDQLTSVIVLYDNSPSSNNFGEITERGGLVTGDFQEINALAITMTAQEAKDYADYPGVEYVAMNAQLGAMLEIARPAIAADGGPGRGNNLEFTGAGVTVAVIDSGVAPHADLGDRLIASFDAREGVVPTLAADPMGHGTHVAGIIAGNGFSSHGDYRGIAPRKSA